MGKHESPKKSIDHERQNEAGMWKHCPKYFLACPFTSQRLWCYCHPILCWLVGWFRRQLLEMRRMWKLWYPRKASPVKTDGSAAGCQITCLLIEDCTAVPMEKEHNYHAWKYSWTDGMALRILDSPLPRHSCKAHTFPPSLAASSSLKFLVLNCCFPLMQ